MSPIQRRTAFGGHFPVSATRLASSCVRSCHRPRNPAATEVVQIDTAVTVTLVFNGPNLPPPSDGGTIVAVTPVLKLGRVLVTLDAPSAGLRVTTAMWVQDSPN